jgi:hypothetical protein
MASQSFGPWESIVRQVVYTAGRSGIVWVFLRTPHRLFKIYIIFINMLNEYLEKIFKCGGGVGEAELG